MMLKTLRTREEGSLLLSTFHLLFFVSFLILSLTGIVYNQLMQLQQISQAYEAKALIEVSEFLLQEKLEGEEVESATLHFSQGKVAISKDSDTAYSLVATMTNGYTSSQTLSVTPNPGPDEVLVTPENLESTELPITEESSVRELEKQPVVILGETGLPLENE